MFMNAYNTLSIWAIYSDLTYPYSPLFQLLFLLHNSCLSPTAMAFLTYLITLDFTYGENRISDCISVLSLFSIIMSSFNYFPLNAIILHR